ncbi:hypothetical protein FHR99_000994 [Litorivivens lipolytica]|uniref:Uncharacterized protein n=1 Tax=Litorivivens lipolytica TaxID=1524264 RepID=A0A7W4Z521_9GAMM|nr:hypothetical protein [Litorivivens lipolytica]MBB3046758.1 hypothetical protein [Litorivivens lipolytica]
MHHASSFSSAASVRPLFHFFLFLIIALSALPKAYAERLESMRSNRVEIVAAGPSGPTEQVYYSVRAYGSGAHDAIHDLTPSQRGSGYRIVSAQLKDTGTRWTYLATRHEGGDIRRTYFDLATGSVGTRAAGHEVGFSPQGGGWYRASLGFDVAGVTTVYVGLAAADGVPFFEANHGTDRIFLSDVKLEAPAATASHSAQPANAAATRALWVWKADTVLNPRKRQELFTFAANRELNTLYIDARTPVLHNQPALAEFIRLAQDRGLAVELLFGKPEWALYGNHHEVLTLVDQAIEFTRRYPEARPTAVHLDIEAHLIHQWQNDRNSVANQLINLYEEVDRRLAAVSLPLMVDMPVWYDIYTLPRYGQSRAMHEWIIDATDSVALMDYRDTEARILNDADTELRYANATGKAMVVGVETMCIEPQQITFCEEGDRFMQSVLRSVNTKLRGQYSAYRGIAIHHYEDYVRLKP